MADAPTPSEISRKEFEVVRRGFDQQAVRGFLHELSALIERLQRAEAELLERVTRAESRLAASEQPDEAAMLELLGEETTRVLTSARDAAADIRSKAEQAAERIIAEASAQAAQTRTGAVAEADKRLAEARAEGEKLLTAARGELERRTGEAEEAADRIRSEASGQAQATRDEAQRGLAAAVEEAAAVVEAAREEGRGMVAEAQAVRERVLRDLATRRKKARLQLEQLNAGRERLLQAYDVVRTTVDEATSELGASVNDARLAAAAAVRRIDAEPEASVDELDEELATARLVDLPIADPVPFVRVPAGRQAREEARASTPPPSAPPAPPAPPAVVDSSADAPAADAFDPIDAPLAPKPAPPPAPPPAVELVPEPEPVVAPEPEPVVAAEPEPEPAPEPAPDVVADVAEPAAPEAPEPAVEPEPGRAAGVFAQLHAGAEAPAEEPPAPELTADAEAFADRDVQVTPIERDLARRLKRVLADEQNDVLDQLRRSKPKGVEDLFPSDEDHITRWAQAAGTALYEAAAAGAHWSGGGSSPTADLADELARGLVLPLRERVERSFVASDGNLDDVSDRVRALYREWKNQRLPEAVPHAVASAYARGLFEATPAGAKVRWVVDPRQGPCPDCDDNVLAGALVKGEDFPTGSPMAPAHPGCRCLVLTVVD
jgi:cell division septum initiation protein DivIVA